MDGKTFANLLKEKEENDSCIQAENESRIQAEKNKSVVMEHLHAASFLLFNEKYSEALNEVNIAVNLSKDSIRLARALSLRGEIYYKTNKHDKAMDDLNNAIETNGYDWEAYKKRAELFLLIKYYDNAIEDLNSALNIVKNSNYKKEERRESDICQIYEMFVKIFYSKHDYHLANEYFEKLRELGSMFIDRNNKDYDIFCTTNECKKHSGKIYYEDDEMYEIMAALKHQL
jgi:tetratricopeptide (TPR) repeat protein